MTESEGSARFSTLDGEKYGKNSVQDYNLLKENLTQKEFHLMPSEILEDFQLRVKRSLNVTRCKVALNGGLLTQIQFNKDTKVAEIKKTIEKAADTNYHPLNQLNKYQFVETVV